MQQKSQQDLELFEHQYEKLLKINNDIPINNKKQLKKFIQVQTQLQKFALNEDLIKKNTNNKFVCQSARSIQNYEQNQLNQQKSFKKKFQNNFQKNDIENVFTHIDELNQHLQNSQEILKYYHMNKKIFNKIQSKSYINKQIKQYEQDYYNELSQQDQFQEITENFKSNLTNRQVSIDKRMKDQIMIAPHVFDEDRRLKDYVKLKFTAKRLIKNKEKLVVEKAKDNVKNLIDVIDRFNHQQQKMKSCQFSIKSSVDVRASQKNNIIQTKSKETLRPQTEKSKNQIWKNQNCYRIQTSVKSTSCLNTDYLNKNYKKIFDEFQDIQNVCSSNKNGNINKKFKKVDKIFKNFDSKFYRNQLQESIKKTLKEDIIQKQIAINQRNYKI